MSKRLKEETIQLFDSKDKRSFNEIYKGQEDLFEDCDDLIDPRFRKLFEETYGSTQNLKQLREEAGENISKWECVEATLDVWDDIKDSGPKMLAQIDLKQRKELKSMMEGKSIKEILKSSLEEMGVESESDINNLSDKEKATIISIAIFAAEINDDWDSLKSILENGIKLNESKIREGFFKDEEKVRYDTYTDNAQNRKLGRAGEKYVKDRWTEPSTIKKIGRSLAGLGRAIVGFFIGAIAGAIPGVIAIVYGLAKTNIISKGLESVSSIANTEIVGDLTRVGGAAVAEIGTKVVWLDGMVIAIVGAVIAGAAGAAIAKMTEENEFESIYKKLKENEGYQSVKSEEHNFSGDEAGPSGDGVPFCHNSSKMGGQGCACQSGHDYKNNPSLGHEPPKGDSTKIHEAFEKIFEASDEDKKFKKDNEKVYRSAPGGKKKAVGYKKKGTYKDDPKDPTCKKNKKCKESLFSDIYSKSLKG